jgi:hypothetical protein
MTEPTPAFPQHFADLPDSRIDRTPQHLLLEVLVITICPTIAGGSYFEEVERFGHAQERWLRRFLALPHGIPGHDTFNRVFAALDPRQFAECVTSWLAVCAATGLKHVAVDG